MNETQENVASVNLVIKNPTRMHDDTFNCTVSLHETLGRFKTKLQQDYPGNPSPESITVCLVSISLFKAYEANPINT